MNHPSFMTTSSDREAPLVKRAGFRFALALAVYCLLGGTRVAADAQREAPYQVENQREHLATLDLGDKSPTGVLLEPTTMTFIGPSGSVVGRFLRLRKSCVELCSDSGDTCHWVGDYDVPHDAGKLLAAFPGTIRITKFRPLEMVKVNSPVRASEWTRPTFDMPVAGVHWASRWRANAEGRTLLEHPGEATTLDLTSCAHWLLSGFDRLDCDIYNSLLYFDKRLLIHSFSEFDQAATDVVASLDVDGKPAYVVLVGLSAQKVYGLLRFNGKEWECLVRPRGASADLLRAHLLEDRHAHKPSQGRCAVLGRSVLLGRERPRPAR
jgi:hypothetical protein